MSVDNITDGKGKFMPSRPATKPNQAKIATFDLMKGRTTHTVAAKVGHGVIEIIAAKAKKEKFIPKNTDELKISIIGYTTGKIIKNATSEISLSCQFALAAKINELVAKTNFDWSYKIDQKKGPVFWKFRRDYPEVVNRKTKSKGKYLRRNRRWSISLMIDMPGLSEFYRQLQNLINEATGGEINLDVPIPHITLYVKGKSLDGIGLGSQAEFDQYKVKRF